MNNFARLWMYYDYDLHGLKRLIVRIEQIQKFVFELVFFFLGNEHNVLFKIQ
jgi:hypothetical protein